MTSTSGPRALTGAVLVLLLASACTNYRVQTDYDSAVRFAELRTYRWMEAKPSGDPRVDSDLVRKRIVNAVDAVLAQKGLKRVEGKADLHVISHAVVGNQIDVDTVTRGYGYRSGPAYTTTRVREYAVGTLILDFVNPGSKQLVWRGSGQARLNERATPGERDALVSAVVAAILERYPPGK